MSCALGEIDHQDELVSGHLVSVTMVRHCSESVQRWFRGAALLTIIDTKTSIVLVRTQVQALQRTQHADLGARGMALDVATGALASSPRVPWCTVSRCRDFESHQLDNVRHPQTSQGQSMVGQSGLRYHIPTVHPNLRLHAIESGGTLSSASHYPESQSDSRLVSPMSKNW